MGADLVGYLVKGRKILLPQDKQLALGNALLVVQQAQALFEAATNQQPKPQGAFPGFLEDFWAEGDHEGLRHYARYDAPSFLQEFCLFWHEPNTTRDAMARPDPTDPKEQLLFVGEPTWGDPPSGRGYRLVSDAFRLNVAWALGIR